MLERRSVGGSPKILFGLDLSACHRINITEVVVSLCVERTCIIVFQSGLGSQKMFLGFGPLSLPYVMFADFDVDPGVIRIPLQSLIVEVHVVQSGIVELIHTQTCKVKFLDRLVLRHWFCPVNHFRQFLPGFLLPFVRIVDRAVIHHQFAVSIDQCCVQVLSFHIGRNFDSLKEELVRIDVDSLVQKDSVTSGKNHPRVFQLDGRIVAQKPFAVLQTLKIDCRELCGVLYALDSFHREPSLFELTDFAGSQPAVVRLVVRIASDHEFQIVAVLV